MSLLSYTTFRISAVLCRGIMVKTPSLTKTTTTALALLKLDELKKATLQISEQKQHDYSLGKKKSNQSIWISSISHCDTFTQARVADTGIHQFYNSAFLSVFRKLNVWQHVDASEWKI